MSGNNRRFGFVSKLASFAAVGAIFRGHTLPKWTWAPYDIPDLSSFRADQEEVQSNLIGVDYGLLERLQKELPEPDEEAGVLVQSVDCWLSSESDGSIRAHIGKHDAGRADEDQVALLRELINVYGDSESRLTVSATVKTHPSSIELVIGYPDRP